MTKLKLALLLMLFTNTFLMAQSNVPVDTFNSSNFTKPVVLYLTGDGGMNDFSKSLVQQWNGKGYPVVALNIKSYLWKAKTPEKMAADISVLLRQYMNGWKRINAILVGYSLGADVLPFVQTRLAADVNNRTSHVVLISPSATTDFEVHMIYSSKGESVPAEINKMTKPTLVMFGSKENDVPEKSISNKNAVIVKVPGDHHYNNDVAGLVQQIVSRL